MSLEEIYKNKTVIVTGLTGFKGSWLALWLLKLGAKVIGISLDPPSKPSHFISLNLWQNIEDIRLDIKEYEKVDKIFKKYKPDFVFHLAAQAIVSKSYINSISTWQTNVIGTLSILEALKKIEHKCSAIFITSDKCYENLEWCWGYRETDKLGGKDPYSSSKAAAEIAISSYTRSFFSKENCPVNISSTRAGNVIGGGDWAPDRIVPDCIKAWSNKETAILRRPTATRPWQHVLEPLSGYLFLGGELFSHKRFNGESFNFGPNSNNLQSVRDLVVNMKKYWNNADYIEAETEGNFHEAGLLKLNCDKALTLLNWRSILSFDKTIEMTSKWYFAYSKNPKDTLSISMQNILDYTELAKEENIIWAI
tara:strand:- start:425 stop:1519 length:1095 start_codon:yes stop_codon:yes gene_type:complete